MKHLHQVKLIKQLYDEGKNIMEHFRNLEGTDQNTIEAILVSYDLQSGQYTRNFEANPSIRLKVVEKLAQEINTIAPKNIIEVGVGEGTTIVNLLKKMDPKPVEAYGFDISWSRINYANAFAKKYGEGQKINFFTGDLFHIPAADSSIEVVYTAHSLEPNGGREKEALQELYRVASKYVVLLEPGYEFASDEARARMEKHGYVRNLAQHATELGYKVIDHRLFMEITPNNPTGLTIIEKDPNATGLEQPLACPVTNGTLENKGDCYYANESLLAYPIVNSIPCLLPHNAIVASHFEID